MTLWTGDEWRWSLTAGTSRPTIDVIEPAEKRKPRAGARRVPFGFARALDPAPVAEPLRWAGDDS